MPGAPLIEQVEPDSTAKEATGEIFQILAGGAELGMIQEAKLVKLRWWERGDKVRSPFIWGWRKETSKLKTNYSLT